MSVASEYTFASSSSENFRHSPGLPGPYFLVPVLGTAYKPTKQDAPDLSLSLVPTHAAPPTKSYSAVTLARLLSHRRSSDLGVLSAHFFPFWFWGKNAAL